MLKKCLVVLIMLVSYLIPISAYSADFTVGVWKQFDQKSKEREVFTYFAAYWEGVKDSIQMFVDLKDQAAAITITEFLMVNVNVSAKEFADKVDGLIKDRPAKDHESMIPYFEKANNIFINRAVTKLPKLEKDLKKPDSLKFYDL